MLTEKTNVKFYMRSCMALILHTKYLNSGETYRALYTIYYRDIDVYIIYIIYTIYIIYNI